MTTYIRHLKTTGGFLQNAPIELVPGLTCIIGARGTCKSTFVETLRFAFDCNPERIASLIDGSKKSLTKDTLPGTGLVAATLADGQVVCEVVEQGPSGDFTLTVERDISSGPRVYREGVKELADNGVIHQIEIYSQGDLQLIAEKDSLRLDLIDRPHKARLDALKQQRSAAAVQLRELGPKIRTKRSEIESRKTEILSLDGLRRHLSELQASRPSLSVELDKERESYLKRKDFLQAIEGLVQNRSAILSKLRETMDESSAFAGLAAKMSELHHPAGEVIKKALEDTDQLVTGLRSALDEQLDQSLTAELSELQKYAEEQNARYYALRKDQQALNDNLKKEDLLKQQIARLERIESELEKLALELAASFRRRQELRDSIRGLSDQIFSLRLKEVENINSLHSEVVILSLEQGARSQTYSDTLTNLLKGSNLRNQSDVVAELAAKLRPADLVDIVEQSDAGRLSTLLGRDLGQMTRLVSFLLDSSGLYELEGVVSDDRLEITMYDEGVPKPVGELSKGQMATALLPLILRNADYPLVFDQPEDDLDNRFIYRTLVEIVRQLKLQRQLIFVTHNANIPVLGEADRVVVMRMQSPMKAAPPIIDTVDGTKEHILTLLEGGKDAFLLRQRKYQELLGN
jgi:hypothetical protein